MQPNQANIKAVITADDRASKTLKQFGTNVGHTSDKVSNFGGMMATAGKTAALAFVAAATATVTFGVKSAASFEQTRIGLENMLGSANKARVLLKQISQFAAETPFEFPELAEATRQLVAFGFSAEDAFDTMKQLGDVSAAVGAPINDLAYLMGTLRAQGRAFTIDIRQFAMRGIPIYEYLAKVLNTNTEEITKMIEAGKIGFPEVQKAFQAMTAEGGAFHDTMSKQSQSLSGLWSTLKDNIGFAVRELVGITQEGDIKEGSLLARIKSMVDGLNQALPDLIKNIQDIFSRVGSVMSDVAPKIERVVGLIAQYLAPAIIAVINTVKEGLIPNLTKLKNSLDPALTEVLNKLAPIIGILIVGAIKMFLDTLNVFLKIGNATIIVITRMAQWFGNLVGVVGNAAAGIIYHFMTIPQRIRGAFSALAGIITAPFRSAFNGIATLWNNTVGKLSFKVPSWIPGVGGKGFDVPDIPRMAEGGIVTKPTVAMIGEAGPEAVVPLNRGMSNLTVHIHAGAFMGSRLEARKFAQIIFDAYKDIAESKNKSPVELLGR